MTNDDEPLDDRRKAAENETVLAAIERLHGTRVSVVLRAPATRPPHVDGGPCDLAEDSRFAVLGEIARGGIGVVYHGRDKDLNRDVALKVLRPEFSDDRGIVQRFVEEAQVGGQLQHPGIVPVYALTLQPDGRPCFAMKLIEGRTFADLLEDNPRGIDLKAVFEQVAQTMAYSHSRGVIHRDLKPANVMVGAFGEVQVVDWGFAKVLGREETQRTKPGQTMIATVRSDAVGSQSIAGSVMGTPAYMPPEQALGRVDDMDERADVFALGAILVEILTGAPPYTGEPHEQLIAAAQGQLDDARARLDACDAPPGLKQLARDCLAPLPKNRPRDAGAVCELLAAHFGRVEQRAREAELAAARARADAALATKSRRRSLALAAIALLLVLVGGGGWQWLQREADARAERAAPRIAAALREATGHEGRGDWAAARAAARQAVDIADTEGVDAGRARSILAALEAAAQHAALQQRRAAEDDELLAELERVRARSERLVLERGADGFTTSHGDERTDAAYAATFAHLGSLDASAERLAASRHAAAFAANLDVWCWLRRTRLPAADWQAIDRVARLVDPAHDDVRDALVDPRPDALGAFAEQHGDELPPDLAAMVGLALANEPGRTEAALSLLERQQQRARGDFWIHMRLAETARRLGRFDLAVRFATAAMAVRPTQVTAACELALSLFGRGDRDEAIAVLRHTVAGAPDDALAAANLGAMLACAGDIDGALAMLRRALELDPTDPTIRTNLGCALAKRGEPAAALEAFRSAAELAPRDAAVQRHLAAALREAGDDDAAAAATRRAVELDRERARALRERGRALLRGGDRRGAVVELRRAIELDPNDSAALVDLGETLRDGGDLGGAVEILDRAIELDPRSVRALDCLAIALARKGAIERAVAADRRAIELDPDATRYARLGDDLSALDDDRGALAAFRRAAELDPTHVWAETRIGAILSDSGDLDGALPHLRRALELDADFVIARVCLGITLDRQGDLDGAIAAYRELPADDSRFTRVRGKIPLLERLRSLRAQLARQRSRLADDPATVAAELRRWQHDPEVSPIRAAGGIGGCIDQFFADVDALLAEASR